MYKSFFISILISMYYHRTKSFDEIQNGGLPRVTHQFRIPLLSIKWFVIFTVVNTLSNKGQTEPVYTFFDSQFEKGLYYYDKSRFNESAEIFSELTLKYPSCYRCVYFKGKSIGRLASRANWFRAIQLAPKPRQCFEKAHLINPNDTEVLGDLIKYYERAPGFLGGGKPKAEAIKIKFLELTKKFEMETK